MTRLQITRLPALLAAGLLTAVVAAGPSGPAAAYVGGPEAVDAHAQLDAEAGLVAADLLPREPSLPGDRRQELDLAPVEEPATDPLPGQEPAPVEEPATDPLPGEQQPSFVGPYPTHTGSPNPLEPPIPANPLPAPAPVDPPPCESPISLTFKGGPKGATVTGSITGGPFDGATISGKVDIDQYELQTPWYSPFRTIATRFSGTMTITSKDGKSTLTFSVIIVVTPGRGDGDWKDPVKAGDAFAALDLSSPASLWMHFTELGEPAPRAPIGNVTIKGAIRKIC